MADETRLGADFELQLSRAAVSWGLLAADGMAALNPLVDCWWLIAVPSFFLVLPLWVLDALARGITAQAK